MSLGEKLTPVAAFGASLVRVGQMEEAMHVVGRFTAECYDKDGVLKWTDHFNNTVVTVGKNHMLNTEFTGAAYTVTGPFMGLISSTSFSAISSADTMSSHAGWLEAGNANAPTYTAPRKTLAFAAAAAGSISLSAPASFGITGTGTVKGGFVVLGAGAVNTIDDTNGTLFSAGLFTGGDRAVVNLDTLNISWSCTL